MDKSMSFLFFLTRSVY